MYLWLQFTLTLLFPLGFLILVILLARLNRQRRTRARFSLIMVVLLNGLLATGLAANFVGRPISRTLIFWWQHTAEYLLPVASAAVLYATLDLLYLKGPFPKRWIYALLGGLVATLVLDPALAPMSIPDVHLLGRIIPHGGWWRIAWVTLWAVPAVASMWILFTRYPRKASPLHRNRVRFLALSIIVNYVGDLFIIRQHDLMVQAGVSIKVLAAIIATINAQAYRLPDLRIILRRVGGVLAVGAATFILFMFAMLGGQAVQLRLQQYQLSFWVTAGLALFMTLCFYPLQYLVRKLIEGLVFQNVFDLDKVLSDYSDRISQTLELHQLVPTMIETVDRTLHTEHAMVVLSKRMEKTLRFTPIAGPDSPHLPALVCSPQSPLAHRLLNVTEPLAQYDVDTLPDFGNLTKSERETLDQWNAELFVPIRARDQVAGVLVLGAKRSGDSYSDPDLVLLKTLADQTAVALDNARLFDDLRALNQEISELNLNLERANLELMELDKLKSGFIGMITHELRSPFVPIDLSLQLIERHGLENMLPEQREQFEQLQRKVSDLRRMIDDLISFASLVSKQRVLQLADVQLEKVVNEAARTLEMMSKARRVSIHIVVVEGMPIISADRERLSDAIYHLMHNAVKFNRSGGDVNVRCGYRDGWATVDVEDTGRGIPAEKLDELGTPFSQMVDSERRGLEGMGLGLALIKYVAQAHGGRLDIQSKLGVGSTFSFQIPVDGPASQLSSRASGFNLTK